KSTIVWDLDTGKAVASFGHYLGANKVAFSPNGRFIATTSLLNDKALLWDAETGKQVASFQIVQGRTNDLRFSRDGRRLLTASNDGVVRIFDVEAGEMIADYRYRGSLSASLSPDGTRLITANGSSATVRAAFPTTKALIDNARQTAPRCLTRNQ